jgi:membrane-bound serine protease (ClpP class)
MAAHVAAMAPGTNIGAAHPVTLGLGGKMDETMARKVENDFVAYARGIANKRERDTKWVEQAIRKSESITAEEALKQNVIDFVAVDIRQLLEKMDGKEIILSAGKVILKTKGASLNQKRMGLCEEILIALSNPNIAYLLLMIGLAGLYFEFAHPGAILPGVVGGVSLILSFYALQTLPVNYAGVLLIIFAIVLFIAEIKIVSHGMLTVAGVISLVLGSIMLFESPIPALRVSLDVMIPTVVIVSLFFVWVIAIAVKAQIGRPVTGQEGMTGEEGYAITAVHTEGKVFVRGEYWNASSRKSVEKGKRIKVIGVKGLKVNVEEVEKEKEE